MNNVHFFNMRLKKFEGWGGSGFDYVIVLSEWVSITEGGKNVKKNDTVICK